LLYEFLFLVAFGGNLIVDIADGQIPAFVAEKLQLPKIFIGDVFFGQF
jgi:hypothetical protein